MHPVLQSVSVDPMNASLTYGTVNRDSALVPFISRQSNPRYRSKPCELFLAGVISTITTIATACFFTNNLLLAAQWTSCWGTIISSHIYNHNIENGEIPFSAERMNNTAQAVVVMSLSSVACATLNYFALSSVNDPLSRAIFTIGQLVGSMMIFTGRNVFLKPAPSQEWPPAE